MRPAVLDASPVIVLARAGFVHVLPRLLSPILLPRAAAEEILAGPADDPASNLLVSAPGWLSLVEMASSSPSLVRWRLGPGESGVLEYARRHPGTVAVLDDKAARRAARELELPVTGTLGLLVAATEAGYLPSLQEAVEAVRSCGLYVDPATVAGLTRR